jgi:hypothetical protein
MYNKSIKDDNNQLIQNPLENHNYPSQNKRRDEPFIFFIKIKSTQNKHI